MNWLELSEQFAQHLESDPKVKGKRTGGGNVIRGHCPRPSHEDSKSSFAYFIQSAGYSCSCGKGKASSLMEELGWKHNGYNWSNAAPVHIATYDYVDEVGEPLYQVLRYCPKDFKQRRPNGHGDFIWSLGDCRRVLYRLPELLAVKDGERVLIVDGEKDVETAYKLGIPATCCNGSMDQWKDSFAALFKGKLVTVIADKDEKGMAQAKAVLESLKAAGVTANVIEMPGPYPPIKDLSDWVQTGETLDSLKSLLEGTSWRKTLHAEPIKATDLAPYIDEPIPFVVDPILIRGCLTQIQGAPKGGKSSFAVYLALCAATSMWPDPDRMKSVISPKIVYITWEDPKLMMAKKLSQYAVGLYFDRTFLPDNLTFIFAPDIFIDKIDHAAALADAIKELGADIVFIDTLSFVHLCDENSASEMKVPMRQLGELAISCNIAICYIHHASKGGNLNGKASVDKSRGSSAIAAAWHVMVDWGMREDGSNVNPVVVDSKYGHGKLFWNVHYITIFDDAIKDKVIGVRWEIHLQTDDQAPKESLPSTPRKRQKILDTLRALSAAQPDGWTTAILVTNASNLGLDTRSVRDHLKALCETGDVLSKQADPKNTMYFKPSGV